MNSDDKKNSMGEQEWEAWSKEWVADLQEQDRKKAETNKE